MAIQIPVLDLFEVDLARRGSFVGKVGHSGFHLFTNLDDDVSTPD